MRRTERAVAGYLTNLIQFGASALLQVVLTPILLHNAGAATLGAFGVLTQIGLFLALTDAGFGAATNRFLPQAYRDGCVTARFSAVLSTARSFLFFSNCLYALCSIALAYRPAALFNFPASLDVATRYALWLIGAWALIRTPLLAYGPALVASQNLARSNFITLAGVAVRLVGSVLIVRAGGGLIGMAAGTILGEAVTMVLNRHFALQLLSGLRLSWGFPDRDLLREMRTFGLHALVWNTASFVTMYSDSIIVSRIFGPTAASRYYATTAPAQWGSNAIMRLMATAVPGVNQLLALNDGIALRATYARLIRYSCGLAVALSSCLLVINRDIVGVWLGDSLYGGDVLNGIQCVYTVWIVIKGVQYSFLVTFGRSNTLTIATVSDAGLKLLLAIYLGRKYGIAGVAAATLLSSFLCTSWAWAVLWHDLGLGAGKATLLELAHSVSVGALMAGGGWGLKVLLMDSAAWLRLPALAGAFCIAWTAILACHTLSRTERVILTKWVVTRLPATAGAVRIFQ